MISGRKINALVGKQFKTMTSNPFVITPLLLIPFMAFMFSLAFDSELLPGMIPLLLGMNMILGAPTVISCLIAEEKEKNTLNVLITSTVSVLDFLISNVLIGVVCTVAINVFIFFVMSAGDIISFGTFMFLSSIGALASALLGAVIGIAAKNQAAASTLVSPLMLLLLLPTFFPDNFLVDNVLYYFFTEQVINTMGDIALNDASLTWMPMAVIAANIAVLGIAFGWFYKRKGLGLE
ncbi:MAG: ABC transporter permease [Defluviitaleaceae bacterium]|nr:ABC transporter permease [Defluviitaleaceae bacterium]